MEQSSFVLEEQNMSKASNIIVKESGDTQVACGQNFGMPNIFLLTKTRVAVMHVYSNKKDDEKCKCAYFLTMYDWN